ncbi:hypothetical protein C0991_010888 [Blastosporella zonata]|nr:hypothetical protein C0991_010888 [Blastosporella zonata]
MLSAPILDPEKNYGIPARTPASTSLWAQLLRKDTKMQSINSGNVVPPIAPLDKNGTSMRILLHDTQAHLDKFSASANKLFTGVDEATREIAMVNTLFQREHDTLTDELVELEQHGTVLTALLPLLPLLQAIPLHIDAARNQITETLTTPAVSLNCLHKPFDDEGKSTILQKNRRSKRSRSSIRSDSSPSPSIPKKARVTPNISAIKLQRMPEAPIIDPADATRTNRKEFGSSLRGLISPLPLPVSSLARCETTVVPSPPKSVLNRASRIGVYPVSSLLSNAVSSSELHPQLHAESTSLKNPLSETHPPVLDTNKAAHPSPVLSSPTVVVTSTPYLAGSLASASRTRTFRPWLAAQKPQNPLAPSTSHQSDTHLSVYKPFDSTSRRIDMSPKGLMGPGCPPAQYSSVVTPSNVASRPPLWSTRLPPQGVTIIRSPDPNLTHLKLQSSRNKTVLYSTDERDTRKPAITLPTTSSPFFPPKKTRGRRSPPKDGRRFIPLDDSEDEEFETGDLDG